MGNAICILELRPCHNALKRECIFMGSSVGFNHVRKGDVIVKIETGIMKSGVVIAQKTLFSGFGVLLRRSAFYRSHIP